MPHPMPELESAEIHGLRCEEESPDLFCSAKESMIRATRSDPRKRVSIPGTG